MTGTMANNEQPPPATVALSYIDVLFGLAAGRAFMSAFDDVSRLSSVEWSHFLVALVLITCSWIGYHLNRSRTHPKEAEFTRDARAPLAQIGIDIALVALYYRLASRIRLDHTTHTELRIVLQVFVLYAVWDFVNLQVSPDRKDTRVRAMVDVAWVGLPCGRQPAPRHPLDRGEGGPCGRRPHWPAGCLPLRARHPGGVAEQPVAVVTPI